MATSKKDRLIASRDAMDRLFSEMIQEEAQPRKKAQKPPKPPKKVFSFRADVQDVNGWRCWADAKGMKVDELGEKALKEYIKRHPLTEEQRHIYTYKMAMKAEK